MDADSANSLSTMGYSGGLLAFGGFGIRYGLPLILDRWKRNKEAVNSYRQSLMDISTKLSSYIEMSEKLQEQDRMEWYKSHSRFDRLDNMVAELLADSIGRLDCNLALNQFSIYLNSVHLRAFIFFQRRCKVNHILGSEDLVRGRYINEGESYASKINTQLHKYTIDGINLSFFWGPQGAQSYCRYLMVELYNLQLLKVLGDEMALGMTDEDIQNAFDRNLSRLMAAFKKWMDEPDATFMRSRDTIVYSLFGDRGGGDIEWT